MAEIKVEKKKPVWPWILAALIILAVILYFVLNDNEAEDDLMEEDTMEEVETTYRNNEINAEDTVAWEDLSPALNEDNSVYKV